MCGLGPGWETVPWVLCRAHGQAHTPPARFSCHHCTRLPSHLRLMVNFLPFKSCAFTFTLEGRCRQKGRGQGGQRQAG